MKARPTHRLKMKQASRDAAERVQSQGLNLPDKPDDEDGIPKMPAEIAALSDKSLMELWSRLCAWGEYLAAQVACARIDERAADRAVEKAQAKAMVEGWTGKATERVAIAKARFLTDEANEALVDEAEELHAYRSLVETLAANNERNTGLVSRELTRRTAQNGTRKGFDL